MIKPVLMLSVLLAAGGLVGGERSHYNYGIPLPELLNAMNIRREDITILISKTEYELTLMAGETRIKSYPVVFGPNPIDDKLRQGDGRTPEGTFRIRAKYPHKLWSKFLWLDYPTAESWKKHREAILKKLIPARSKIGGEIGIHGIPAGTDAAVDRRINWTAGCVSLKNKDVNEIYGAVVVGTTVEIRK